VVTAQLHVIVTRDLPDRGLGRERGVQTLDETVGQINVAPAVHPGTPVDAVQAATAVRAVGSEIGDSEAIHGHHTSSSASSWTPTGSRSGSGGQKVSPSP